MAIDGAIPVTFEDLFPHGAFASGEVTPVKDWDLSTAEKTVQQEVQVLAESGELVKLPVWQVTVHDGDEDARETLLVWVVADRQPVLPERVFGKFRPVELVGLAVEPFVNRDKCKAPWGGRQHRCGARVAFRYWARALRGASEAPKPTARASAGAGNGRAEQ